MPFLTRFICSQLRTLPPLPESDLSGRVFMITGANSGIGLEIAHQLAACGPAKLILAVRNTSSGEEAKETILSRLTKAIHIEVWQVDMASFASVVALAERAAALDRLDGVAMNAGLFGSPKEIFTADGHEVVTQVNFLSPVLLSLLLAPVLDRTTDQPLPLTQGLPSVFPARIVYTGTILVEVADTSKIDSEKPLESVDAAGSYRESERYNESKLLLHIMIRKLILQYPKIAFIDAAPGLVISPFFKDQNLAMRTMVRMLGRTAEQGARNITSAMLKGEKSVDFYEDCEPHNVRLPWLNTPEGVQCGNSLWRDVCGDFRKFAPGMVPVA